MEGQVLLLQNEAAELRVNRPHRYRHISNMRDDQDTGYDPMYRFMRGVELLYNNISDGYRRKNTTEPYKMCG